MKHRCSFKSATVAILVVCSVVTSSPLTHAADDGISIFSNGYAVSPLDHIRFDEQNRSYSLVFTGPIGAEIVGVASRTQSKLTVGIFDGSAGSDVYALVGNARCSDPPEVQILQAEYEADALVRFAARTRVICSGSPQMTLIAYRATVPLDVALVSQRTFTASSGYAITASVGYDRSAEIPITNAGTTVLHPRLVPLDPSSVPDDLFVSADGCTAGVVPGATCTLRLTWSPTIEGFWKDVLLAVVSEFDSWGVSPVSGSAVLGIDLTALPPPPPGDGIQPMDPARLLDTRVAVGTSTTTPLSQAPLTVAIAGRAGIPFDATAVVANVTVTEPSVAGFVSLYPSDSDVPDVSNVNFTAGQTVANMAVVALGADGALKVFNGNGTAHVVIDVLGWLSPQEPLVFVPEKVPYRLIDTREPNGTFISDNHPLRAGEARPINRPIRNFSSSAVLVNITVTQPTATTYVTAYAGSRSAPDPAARPNASTLNVEAGQTRANLAIVAADPTEGIVVYNNAGFVDLVIDVLGTFVPASSTSTTGRIVAIRPFRAVDTRVSGDSFGPYEVAGYRFPTTVDDLPIGGLVFNTTVTEPTAPGFLTMFARDAAQIPYASNLNFESGQTVPNNVWVRLAPEPDNYVDIGHGSAGRSNILLDLQALILG